MPRHSSKYRSPKRALRRAVGTLLLALPLWGLAFQPTPAHAQPAPLSPQQQAQAQALAQTRNVRPLPMPPLTIDKAPLSTKQQSEIERILSISRNEEFCHNALDLKLENATIEDVIARIKAAFPQQQVEIRQRDARPLQVSLDLQETTVGTVLQGVAELADCKLWVLPDGLLIAPPGKLNQVERELAERRLVGDWGQRSENYEEGWSNNSEGRRAFANVIAREVKANNLTPDAKGYVKTVFGQFSPQAQQALQQLVTWAKSEDMEDRTAIIDDRLVTFNVQPFVISPNLPIDVNLTEPRWIEIQFGQAPSDPYPNQIAMNILLTK